MDPYPHVDITCGCHDNYASVEPLHKNGLEFMPAQPDNYDMGRFNRLMSYGVTPVFLN